MKHRRSLVSVIIAICIVCSSAEILAQSNQDRAPIARNSANAVAQSGQATATVAMNLSSVDSLAGFNETFVRSQAATKGLSPYETEMYVAQAKRIYIIRAFYPEQLSSVLRQAESSAQRGPINPTPQAPCTNMDFETGTFTGWTGYIGDNTLSSSGPLQNILPGIQTSGVDALLSDANSRHTIVTAASGNDPCGGFPMVAPGGNYSVRLGGTTGNYQGEILEQTFTVGPGNTSLTYQYAVVLNDGGHSAGEQPYFKIELFDQSGNLVPCSQFYIEATGSTPGFLPCGNGTSYKPWTTVSVDLSAFVSTNVTLRFTVAGCIYAGHYGYAYVDCSCVPYTLAVSDSLCGGNSVTINAPIGSASYNWTLGPPGGPSLGTSDSLVISNAGNYYVELISVTGCTTLMNVNIGAYAQPTAAFNTSFAPCDTNYTFNNSSTIATGTMTYFWDFGDPSTAADTSIATSPSYTYTPPGPYQVWLYALSQNGCIDSVSQFVNPGSGGLASFTNTEVCAGSSTSFTDGSTNPTGWSWHFGDPSTLADSSNMQNPVYTYPAAGTYTVTLTANTLPCASIYTSTVIVHAIPVSSFTFSQNCSSLTGNFTSTSTIGNGDTIASYSWNFGDPTSGGNNISSQENPTHVFTSSGTFTVTLVTTSTFGCQNTTTQTVVVGTLPTASFTAASSTCANVPVQFTNTSQNAVNWYWNFGDPFTSADTSLMQNPSYTYASIGTYTVLLVAQPSSACSDTAQLIITIAGATPAFAATTVCSGTPTSFTDLSTVSNGSIVQWFWDFGVTTSTGDTAVVQNPQFTYSTGGIFNVTLTVTTNTGCVTLITQQVTVGPLPIFLANPSIVCVDDGIINLSATPSGGSWSGPSVTGNQFTPSVAGVGTHILNYIVTDSTGCTGNMLDTIIVMPCTGINEQSEMLFSMFPNPASTGFTFNSSTHGMVEIFDANGKLVMTKSITSEHSEIATEVLSEGLYLVRFTSESGMISTSELQVIR